MNYLLNSLLLGIIGPQEIMVILVVVAVIFGISLIPMIFFLLTLQNTLNAISFENRKMEPSLVWLSLIPLFGLVWQFIIVDRMAGSLQAEFAKRGMATEEVRPGNSIGLAYCILFCCSLIPFLGYITSIAGLIC
jgi:hypothetical protein